MLNESDPQTIENQLLLASEDIIIEAEIEAMNEMPFYSGFNEDSSDQ